MCVDPPHTDLVETTLVGEDGDVPVVAGTACTLTEISHNSSFNRAQVGLARHGDVGF
jgi:hypothetical protein